MRTDKEQFSLNCGASKKQFPTRINHATAWLRLRTAYATRLLPLLLLLTLPAVVQAQFTYTTNNGTITITKFTGSFLSRAVTIPATIFGLPVTSIGTYAFSGSTFLLSVTIPNSVTSIGDHAFYICSGLTNVAIPDSVTNIASAAFFNCYGLTNVMIPTSVTSIGQEAFGYCTSLTAITVDALNSIYASVDGVLFDKSLSTLIQWPGGKAGSYTVPNSVTNIGTFAFFPCPGLTNVTIPTNVTSIGYAAFIGCYNLTAFAVYALNSVYASVDGVLFDKSQSTLIQCPGGKTGSYTIPDSVTNIGAAAFDHCTSLTYISIPDSITSIGQQAFQSCTSLSSVTIPEGVMSIGHLAFYGCTSLSSVTIPNGVTYIGNSAFAQCIGLTNVTIGNSVTNIAIQDFNGCTNLMNVTIGPSVTSIGQQAFALCNSLTGLYFRGNAPSLGSAVFSGDNNAAVYYLPGTTGWGPIFGGLPTALWKPQVQTSDTSFGVRTNQFGFNIVWASGQVVVVEACTNLANPIWFPLQTNILTGGSSYFSDPQWTDYPARFYRLRSP